MKRRWKLILHNSAQIAPKNYKNSLVCPEMLFFEICTIKLQNLQLNRPCIAEKVHKRETRYQFLILTWKMVAAV